MSAAVSAVMRTRGALLAIGIRFAGGSRLEPLVQPVILLGHFTRPLFDESVQAPGVGLKIAAWKIPPGRVKSCDIACAARQLTCHAGNDDRMHNPCDAGQRGDRSRRYAEKWRENGVARTEIHVRQVVNRD